MTAKKDENNAQTETMNTEINTEVMNTETVIASEFEIDPEVLEKRFNFPRIPRLTYGIVINEKEAGLFIPEKNLSKCGWIGTPELIELDLTGKERGVFFTKARMIVLGRVEPYIRYKDKDTLAERGENPALALTAIGWYEENKHLLDKTIMDAVSEHMVMFLSESNELLHQRPVRIRFKNVALWSMKEALDEYYLGAEIAFAGFTGQEASGKDDRWRSLILFDCEFKGTKEGEGKNQSYCCKVISYQQATVENVPCWFLGTKTKKRKIWEIFDMNAAGFALSGGINEPTKSALPPSEDEDAPQLPPVKINLLKPKA